jgi:hypothetical protein
MLPWGLGSDRRSVGSGRGRLGERGGAPPIRRCVHGPGSPPRGRETIPSGSRQRSRPGAGRGKIHGSPGRACHAAAPRNPGRPGHLPTQKDAHVGCVHYHVVVDGSGGMAPHAWVSRLHASGLSACK